MTAQLVEKCPQCKRTCTADMELKEGWSDCPMHGPVRTDDIVEYEEG